MQKSTNGLGLGALSPPVPPVIPEYHLERLIGDGSYGQVWLARNMFGVFRAVKVVYEKNFTTKAPYNREFNGIKKFEPISRSHEGFIDVLQVGQNEKEGFFYYVMELGDDQETGQTVIPAIYKPNTLSCQAEKTKRFSVAECIQVGTAIASALHHLHQHNLVHRDIKPSNILFVNGVPKLADIGLVADQDEARSNVGTDGFIPPEGHGRPQGDIYSLGKVLYEMAMGRDRNDYPQLPLDWAESPNHDQLIEINQIIIRACEPVPQDRYPSAEAMLEDLRVLEGGKSLRRLRVLERRMTVFKKWGSIATLFIVVASFLTFFFYRDFYNKEQIRLGKVRSAVGLGARLVEEGNLVDALPRFAQALKLDHKDPVASRTHRIRIGAVARQCPKLFQCWPRSGCAICARFSPNGNHFAASDEDGFVLVYTVGQPEPVGIPIIYGKGTGGARGLSFSPDGEVLLVSGSGNVIKRYRWRTGEEILPEFHHSSEVYDANFSPDGKSIVAGGADGRVVILDNASGKELQELKGHFDSIYTAVFSHDGRKAVTASHDGTARIWDVSSGKELVVVAHNSSVYSATFSPDDTKIATGSMDQTAQLWDAVTGNPCSKPLEHTAAAESVDFSPDGRYLVTSGWDFVARVWDLKSGQLANPPLPHGGQVMYSTFSPDARYLVTTSIDKTVRLWDLEANNWLPPQVPGAFSPDGNLRCQWAGNVLEICKDSEPNSKPVGLISSAVIEDVSWSPNGAFLLSIGSEKEKNVAQCWSLAGSSMTASCNVSNRAQTSWRISNDGEMALSFGGSSLSFWKLKEGKEFPILDHVPGPIQTAVFSPDCRYFCAITGTNALVWAVEGKKLLHSLPHTLSAKHAEFNPNSTRLVTCTEDTSFALGYAQVWKVSDGTPAGPRLWHKDGIRFATFSPDGKLIATASEDFTANLWSAETGEPMSPPLQHKYQVHTARFSNNGLWLVTASEDQTARIWDVLSGEPLTPPVKLMQALVAAQFVKGDTAIYTRTRNGLGFVWDLLPDGHSVSEVEKMAEFMSGQNVDRTNSFGMSGGGLTQRVHQLQESGYVKAESQTDKLAWHERQAASSEQNHQPFAARFHLSFLLQDRPSDLSILGRLANVDAALGHWDEAEKEIKQVLGGPAADLQTLCRYAHICLALGKTNEFHQACWRILVRCPEIQNVRDLNVVLPVICLLPRDQASYQNALGLVQRFGGDPRVQIACGFLDYRTMRFEYACKRLDSLTGSEIGSGKAMRLLLYAMSQAQRSEVSAAAAALEQAESFIKLLEKGHPFFNREKADWEQKLDLQTLLREAKQVVAQAASKKTR